MGGLFGGFLSLVDVIGGYILYVLIGSPAWKDKKEAREARLVTGSIVLGSIFGGIFVFIWVQARILNDDWYTWYFNLLFGALAALVFVGFVNGLEEVREIIDRDEAGPKSKT